MSAFQFEPLFVELARPRPYDAEVMEMGAPVENIMQLTDAQLAQLVGADGASVPVQVGRCKP